MGTVNIRFTVATFDRRTSAAAGDAAHAAGIVVIIQGIYHTQILDGGGVKVTEKAGSLMVYQVHTGNIVSVAVQLTIKGTIAVADGQPFSSVEEPKRIRSVVQINVVCQHKISAGITGAAVDRLCQVSKLLRGFDHIRIVLRAGAGGETLSHCAVPQACGFGQSVNLHSQLGIQITRGGVDFPESIKIKSLKVFCLLELWTGPGVNLAVDIGRRAHTAGRANAELLLTIQVYSTAGQIIRLGSPGVRSFAHDRSGVGMSTDFADVVAMHHHITSGNGRTVYSCTVTGAAADNTANISFVTQNRTGIIAVADDVVSVTAADTAYQVCAADITCVTAKLHIAKTVADDTAGAAVAKNQGIVVTVDDITLAVGSNGAGVVSTPGVNIRIPN